MNANCYLCLESFTEKRPQVKQAPPICKPCWITSVDAPLPDEFFDDERTPTQPMTIPAKWFTGYDD